jgi:tetratricopeptide (TPR) repeat protein
MSPHTRHRLLAAVAAALPLFAAAVPAPAQVRVNQNGRAHDANTRVGSDGSNDRNNGIDRRGQTVTGNQIVTGNVTGGRAFRGNLGYRDPLEFRGAISRPSDRFVRDSVGAPTRTQPNVGYQSTAYYGDDRATPPPPGFRQQGSTPGFTGLGQTTIQTNIRNPAYQSTTQIFGAGSTLLRPSDQVFDGRRDLDGPQSILTASPLYGVRPIGGGPVSGVNDAAGAETTGSRDRFRLNRGQIDNMQRELNEAGGDDAAGGTDGPAGAAGGANSPARPQQPLNGALPDTSLRGGTRANQLSADRLAGSVETGQSLQRRTLVPPARQSAQYRQLQQRLAQRQGGRPLTDEEANRQARLLTRVARQTAPGAAAAAAPGADAAGDPDNAAAAPAPEPGAALPRQPRGDAAAPRVGAEPEMEPGAAPENETAPDPEAPAPDAPAAAEPQAAAPAPANAAAEPLRIKSLAEGVEAKGLRDLLASAEELMKAGKFASAIEKYGAALEVAPNNPLIVLGRAHAELASTYYGRAEQSMRQAIEADPALLMAQYDLESFVGRDRLGFVVKDLKQVAQTETRAARPQLLLAYIAYSMPGHEAAAAQYLDAAAERSRRPDPLIDLMRKNWNLPAAPATPEAPDAEAPEAPPADEENK